MLLLLICLIFSPFSLALSQDSSDIATEFIGKVYTGTKSIALKGYDNWGGGLIFKTLYWTTELYNYKSKKLILILKTEIGREEKYAKWKILDAIITDLDTSKFDKWDTDDIDSCSANNTKIIHPVLIITDRSNNSIKDAWRIDPNRSKIQRLDTRELKCIFYPPED